MVNSMVSLLRSYIKEGVIIKLRSFGILLALSFLLASCSSGPSDKEIITALKADFNKGNMPQCFVHSLLGGGIYQDTLQFEILKKGDLVKESPQAFMPGNYYPARVRVKGKGYGTQLFGKKEDHQFDCTLEIQVRKGDYKEWKADFDPFKSDWNKTEAPPSAPVPNAQAESSLPNFELLDNASGRKLNSSELKNKVVLLAFWASWSQPCKETAPAIESVYKSTANNASVKVLTILHKEDFGTAMAFLKSSGYSFPLYSPSGEDVSRLYGVSGVPEIILVDKNGTVTKKYVGPIGAAEANTLIELIDNLTRA